MDEFASFSGGQKPTNFHAQSVAILVLSPFLTFVTILALFTFAYSDSSTAVWVVVVACTGMSLFLLALPNKRPEGPTFYMQLGVLCLVATGVATLFGYYNWNRHMSYDAAYDGQRAYSNVLPTEPALAHLDAGKIVFSPDAKLSMAKAVGYKDGSMYCVAPIIDSTPQSLEKFEFFAAGQDCCQEGGGFTCDEADNPKAHGGMVYLKFVDSALLDNFRKAGQHLAATHGIAVSPDALFVKWVRDPDGASKSFQNSGVSFFIGTSAVYLVVCIVMGFTVHFSQRNAMRITKTAGL